VGCALEGGERARRRGAGLFSHLVEIGKFLGFYVCFFFIFLNNIIFFNMRKQILKYFFINFIIYKT
jgi:hypothetical protein